MELIEIQRYFAERLVELFNRNTIDSYRVRCHNPFSLLRELEDVIKNWLEGNIQKFDTVKVCVEETVDALKEDEVLDFSFFKKNIFLEAIEALNKCDPNKNHESCKQSLHLVRKCIEHNESCYIEGLYHSILVIISKANDYEEKDIKPTLDRLSRLTRDLACELLNEGYSQQHLYEKSRHLLYEITDFNSLFGFFRKDHNHNVAKHCYEVVLKLNGGNNLRLQTIDGFVPEVPSQLVSEKSPDEFKTFMTNRGNQIFYYCKVNAHDSVMAVSLAKEMMENKLDRAMLGYSMLDVSVQKKAFAILYANDNLKYIRRSTKTLDTIYADNKEIVEEMNKKIDDIVRSDSISEDVKDRLASSLRHLRIGNTESDSGQQLVNYWVALEFIFSSPKAYDSTIARIEKNLLNILKVCYIQRRLSYTLKLLKRNGKSCTKELWLMTDDEFHALINSHSSLLLKHHLFELKSNLFCNSDKTKSFLSTHIKHLYWQLYRIYRFRNKLIHEAAILPGLGNVIRSLRFYLVFLLNQIICFFYQEREKNTHLDMESFFYEYDLNCRKLDSILTDKSINQKEKIKQIMEFPIYQELIRQK